MRLTRLWSSIPRYCSYGWGFSLLTALFISLYLSPYLSLSLSLSLCVSFFECFKLHTPLSFFCHHASLLLPGQEQRASRKAAGPPITNGWVSSLIRIHSGLCEHLRPQDLAGGGASCPTMLGPPTHLLLPCVHTYTSPCPERLLSPPSLTHTHTRA